jgi:hypothetical protein
MTKTSRSIRERWRSTAIMVVVAAMLAVCTAADSLTANSGRGAMNARRGIRRGWCSMAVLIVFAAALFICGTASAENVTTSGGNIIYELGGGLVTVDSFITANGSDASPDATVEISGGFQSGDVLSGGDGSWDGNKGILTITDAANWSDLQGKLRSVTFDTTSGDTSDRVIAFTVGCNLGGDALLYEGHYYEFVSGPLSWDNAKPAAESRSHAGLDGYLATVSSSGENDFISSKLSGEGWMGASDAPSYNGEGNWYWVTGPENGTQFWQGDWTGSVVNGCYNNWHSGEPNDCAPSEDYAHFLVEGTWNDLPDGIHGNGYVVEYGGPGFGGNASDSNAMDTKTIIITESDPPVPELPTILLFAVGLLMLAGYARVGRRK